MQKINILAELGNRNKITLKFEKLMSEEQSVSLALINLDNFKPINEIHGRNAGDIVLRQVA